MTATAFWSRVIVADEPDSCWGWRGVLDKDGYGRYGIDGRQGGEKRAHRVAYALSKGPIPDGMVVRHSCDSRTCTNPKHLLIGTHADNVRDRVQRGRSYDAHGERNNAAKLTWSAVEEIRALTTAGVRHRDIADRFSVARSLVSRIANNKIWNPATRPAHR